MPTAACCLGTQRPEHCKLVDSRCAVSTCDVRIHLQAERQRLAAIPGMMNQNQPEAQEMNDA